MSQEAPNKTQTRTEKQIINVSEKLHKRAQRLDLRGTNVLGNEIRISYANTPGQSTTRLEHNRDNDNQPVAARLKIRKAPESSDFDIGVSKEVTLPSGDKKGVMVGVNPEFGAGGEVYRHTPTEYWVDSEQLDEAQTRKASAEMLGQLRSEVVSREIATDNKNKKAETTSDLDQVLKA